jgi:cobalt-zinc-cadmium efflux system membrane fusion protein
MSTPTKSSLTKRLPRHRLWFAGAGVAGIAMVSGWMMLNTNPGNALMRPPAVVETDGAFRPSDSQWAGFRFA